MAARQNHLEAVSALLKAVKEDEAMQNEYNCGWHSYIRGGAAGGLGRQHRFTRTVHGWIPSTAGKLKLNGAHDSQQPTEGTRVVQARGGDIRPLAAQGIADYQAQQWGDIWSVGKDAPQVEWPNDLGPELPRPSAQRLREVLRTFCRHWLGLGCLSPQGDVTVV